MKYRIRKAFTVACWLDTRMLIGCLRLSRCKVVLLLLLVTLLFSCCLLLLLSSACSQAPSEENVKAKMEQLQTQKTFQKRCYKGGRQMILRSSRLPPSHLPLILHTTWKSSTLDDQGWRDIDRLCKLRNKNFVFCHWSDAELESLVAAMHPNFLHHFLTYPYPIQVAVLTLEYPCDSAVYIYCIV